MIIYVFISLCTYIPTLLVIIFNDPVITGNSRRDSVSKALWDEHEIEISIRNLLLSDPTLSKPDLTTAMDNDDVEAVAKLVPTKSLSQAKMNVLLLYSTWKGSVKVGKKIDI